VALETWEKVKSKKKAATEAEDFKEAKKMKDKQKELEEKMQAAHDEVLPEKCHAASDGKEDGKQSFNRRLS